MLCSKTNSFIDACRALVWNAIEFSCYIAAVGALEVLDCKFVSGSMQLNSTNLHWLVAFRAGDIDE
jgi:hypothetical protein